MFRRGQFEIIEGQVSGLKILTVLGRKIDHRGPFYTYHQLWLKIYNRKPIKDFIDLEDELVQIRTLQDQINLLEPGSFGSPDLYFVLLKAIHHPSVSPANDDFLTRHKSFAKLYILFSPVWEVKKHHHWDGELLYETLMGIADELRCNDELARLRRRKEVVMEKPWKFEKIDTPTKPFDAQEYHRVRGEEFTRKREESKIKEAELRERKLALRRQKRRERLELIRQGGNTVGVVAEMNSTEDQRAERKSSDTNAEWRFVERRRQRRHRPPMAPRGHIARHPRCVACVNERDNGKCLLKNRGCQGDHDNQVWSHHECDNPCYLKTKICPFFFPRKDGQFCLCKHTSKPHGSDAIKQAHEQALKEFPTMFEETSSVTLEDIDELMFLSACDTMCEMELLGEIPANEERYKSFIRDFKYDSSEEYESCNSSVSEVEEYEAGDNYYALLTLIGDKEFSHDLWNEHLGENEVQNLITGCCSEANEDDVLNVCMMTTDLQVTDRDRIMQECNFVDQDLPDPDQDRIVQSCNDVYHMHSKWKQLAFMMKDKWNADDTIRLRWHIVAKLMDVKMGAYDPHDMGSRWGRLGFLMHDSKC